MESETRLKIFSATAAAQSISKAAEALGISQPAVSRHIKLLEAEIGCILFRRHGRGVDLTYDGQRLYEVVAPSLNKINAVMGQLQLASESVAGQLRIASVHTLNSYFLVPTLKNILAEFPALTIQMLERSSLEVGTLVERGVADVGLAYDSMIVAENLHLVRLHDERMQLFHSRHDDVWISNKLNEQGQIELDAGLEFIATPSGYALRQMMDQRLDVDARHAIQVETIDLMLEMVRSGLGVCILPENMPRESIEDSGLLRKEIAAPRISRTVVAIVRSNSLTTPAIKYAIREFIKFSNMQSQNPDGLGSKTG